MEIQSTLGAVLLSGVLDFRSIPPLFPALVSFVKGLVLVGCISQVPLLQVHLDSVNGKHWWETGGQEKGRTEVFLPTCFCLMQ